MRVVRPAHGVRFIEAIRPAPIQLAAGAGEQVVDAVVTGMLEVVLMAGEHDAYAGTCEERQQRVHPVGVVMIWPRTERRVPGCLVARAALPQIEVVEHLLAVVPIFGLGVSWLPMHG